LWQNGTTPKKIQVLGLAKRGPTIFRIAGNDSTQTPASGRYLTYVANPYAQATSSTIVNLGLYTGNPSTGFVGGTSPSSADNIIELNSATGGLTTQWYSTTNQRWQTGLQDASAYRLPRGQAPLIKRLSTQPGFYWKMPEPQ